MKFIVPSLKQVDPAVSMSLTPAEILDLKQYAAFKAGAASREISSQQYLTKGLDYAPVAPAPEPAISSARAAIAYDCLQEICGSCSSGERERFSGLILGERGMANG